MQPNLGIPVTRGFKIASLNLVSLYKHVDQLRIYTLSKTVDILAINETRLDSSIQMGRSVSLDIPLKGKIEIEMAVV